MILKYYNNGWNYLDELKKVKWINKNIELIDLKEEKSIGGRIYITPSELANEIDSVTRIEQEIIYQLEKYNSIDIHVSCIHFDYDMEKIKKDLSKNNMTYIRIVIYEYGDETRCVVFNHVGYLLNDVGKTVEKLN